MDKYKKKIYDNYITNHNKNLYGDMSLAKISAYFPVLDHYYGRHLPANKDAAILDIGCGDGNSVYWMQQRGYKNASGVDVSMEQIEKGKSMGINNLVSGDIVKYLADSKQQYDVILAKDVIEHFTRDEVFEILELVHKNLKEGGRFIMQVPNGQGIYYTSIFYGDYTHEMAYTASSINQVALNNGFKRTHCYPTGPVPKNLAGIIRSVLWKLKVTKVKFWKMIETGSPSGIFTQNIIAVMEK